MSRTYLASYYELRVDELVKPNCIGRSERLERSRGELNPPRNREFRLYNGKGEWRLSITQISKAEAVDALLSITQHTIFVRIWLGFNNQPYPFNALTVRQNRPALLIDRFHDLARRVIDIPFLQDTTKSTREYRLK